MNSSKIYKDSLKMHRAGKPGKLEICLTKSLEVTNDLSLAYSPGVAAPCLEIKKDPKNAYEYTGKGNLVAVISNGTAVLGLGNIGALASKPVMEGKAILFKKFGNVDAVDLELDTNNVKEFVNAVKVMEPTFSGINLEDIKSPECFEIEKKLQKEMNIPVFHDDQHGTAIVTSAALINSLKLVEKDIGKVKIVVSGAGAAALACIDLMVELGVKKKNIKVVDSKGVIYSGREEGMNKYKKKYVVKTDDRTLEDAVKNADVFLGLSRGGVLKPSMLKTMAKDPIVFACANPDPEILPEIALETRDDVIIATGRSDYNNQINNVLCFPYIFRGALDVRASEINLPMKKAAVYALAELAREEVSEKIKELYSWEGMEFGRNYILPKPFDDRLLPRIAVAVSDAAIKSGVSQL
jgi:malate dehydrogenase (oxaloacetate-decarboxylating)(NADP+)